MTLANGIREQTTTTGTGNLTVASVSGFVRFSEKHGTSSDYPFPYTITDANGAPIEGGIGYLSGTNTLVRQRVIWSYASSTYDDTAPSAISLAAGTKYVLCAEPWQAIRSSPMYGAAKLDATPAYNAIFNTLARNTGSGGNGWTNLDRMHYWPVLFDEGADCSGIVMSGVTNASSYGLAAALYSVRADGRPGARIATIGKVTPVATTAPQSFSFTGGNIAVLPGVYYLGAMVTNTNLTFDPEVNKPFLLGSTRSMAGPQQALTENITAGWTDCPASAGASISIYNGLGDHPCFALQVA